MCSCRDSFILISTGFFSLQMWALLRTNVLVSVLYPDGNGLETIHSESYSPLIEQYAHDKEKPNVRGSRCSMLVGTMIAPNCASQSLVIRAKL